MPGIVLNMVKRRSRKNLTPMNVSGNASASLNKNENGNGNGTEAMIAKGNARSARGMAGNVELWRADCSKLGKRRDCPPLCGQYRDRQEAIAEPGTGEEGAWHGTWLTPEPLVRTIR